MIDDYSWSLSSCELINIANALQLNELSALRNTFYPEYKYLVFIFIWDICIYIEEKRINLTVEWKKELGTPQKGNVLAK